jgi:hypothetical protein
VEPDALLRLTYPSLRSFVHSVRVSTPVIEAQEHDIAQCAVTGFPDDNSWALAIDAKTWNQWVAVPVTYDLELDSGAHLLVEFRPVSGMRATQALDLAGLDLRGKRAPLVVRIHSSRGTTSGTGVVVTVQIGSASPIMRELWHGDEHAWGRISFVSPGTRIQARGALGEDIVLPSLPIGLPCYATALAAEAGAYGRCSFVNDGAERVIELQPGGRIRGRLHSAENQQPLSLKISWELLKDSTPAQIKEFPSQAAWWFDTATLPVAEHGEFETIIPQRVPIAPEADWPVPEWLHALISVPGCSTREAVVKADVDSIYDLGVIEVANTAPRIELATGSGLDLARMSERGLSLFMSTPPCRLTIETVSSGRGGRLFIYPETVPECEASCLAAIDLRTRQPFKQPWPFPLPDQILVEQEVQDARAFSLSSDGLYHVVSTRPLRVRIVVNDMPAGVNRVFCGWSWAGTPTTLLECSAERIPLDEVYQLQVPIKDANLWWSSDAAGPLAGTAPNLVPLDGTPSATMSVP